jgi:hypothetical protein
LNLLGVWACLPVLSTPALSDFPPAPQGASVETIDVRVMISSPGTLVVDRGSVDFVRVGDVVVFELRGKSPRRGRVTKVDERSATVKLEDPAAVVPSGARGKLEMPKERRQPQKKEPPPEAPKQPDAKPADSKPAPVPSPAPPVAPKPDAKKAEAPQEPKPDAAPAKSTQDHPEWSNTDKAWTKGMPLLTELPPVRPEQRTPTVSGSLFSSAQYVRAADGGSSSSFVRAGGSLTAENLFGDGATLHVEGDVHYRNEVDGDHGVELLPYEVSYTWGGTRFDPTRLEVGRFLQYGMPEFGVVDGVEYARRLSDGSSFGASLGFMPEPDDDFESFADFQIAAWYRWVLDDSERLALRGGFEQTFHHGSADRDLFVADLRWAMDSDLDFHGTTWIDLYGSGDAGKSALELTQALLVLTRRFDESSGGDVTYRHQAFPLIDRDGEFTPPATLQEIEDDHLDELAASAYHYTDSHLRLHGEAGAWYDEDETGGSADAGLEFPEVLIHDLRADFTAFGSRGQFSTLFGGRVTCSLPADDGRWDLSYEYANHRLHGFSSNLNDLVQQRVWLSRSFHWGGGWSFSLDAQATWWDTDVSWAAGWFVQKTF